MTLDGSLKIDEWQTDGQSTPGTDSTIITGITKDQLIQTLLEWNDGEGDSSLKFEWESATTPRQIIPSKYLYPKAEQQKLYEFHGFFESPTSPGAAIREILFQTNSLMQDVKGKLRFYCYEQLNPDFTLPAKDIISFDKARRRDILQSDPVTIYEAQFKSLNSQYLEEPTSPVQMETGYFARKSFENVKVVNLFNTTHWRAIKILNHRIKLETGNDYLWEATAPLAKTYPICAGDLITATHRKIGASPKTYLVRRVVESGVAESKEIKTNDIEKNKFVLQEWSS